MTTSQTDDQDGKESLGEDGEDEETDYVFRIIYVSKPDNLGMFKEN